jgi:2'-5' RNA ligase
MPADGLFRLFLAIDPPDGIIREIEGIQRSLQRIVAGEVRWVKAGGMHLTLKFFGDVPADDIEKISRECAATAATAFPFKLSFHSLGTFPPAKHPRVLYLGLDGDTKRLTSFQTELEGKLSDRDFPREERRFTPHLTLARIKTLREPDRLVKEMNEGNARATGQFTTSELVLFKSNLTPGGSVYTRLAAYRFSGGTG